jgi:hypothetical protein
MLEVLDHLKIADHLEPVAQGTEPLEVHADEREIRSRLSLARVGKRRKISVDAYDIPGHICEKPGTVSLAAASIHHHLPRTVGTSKMVSSQVTGKVRTKARIIIGQTLAGEGVTPPAAPLADVLRAHH